MKLTLILILSTVVTISCKSRSNSQESVIKDAAFQGTKGANEYGENNISWRYYGPMQPMTDVTMVVSILGRTLRVEGKFEEGLTNQMKDAINKADHITELPNGRFRIVYPIAVGETYNENSGNYRFRRIYPRRPYQYGNADYSSHSWHLLPFLGYAGKDGSIGFHSPITEIYNRKKQTKMLHLYRGAVSGGCKRMALEHIIELSVIFGIDIEKDKGTVYRDSSGKDSLDKINARGRGDYFINVIKNDYDRIDSKIVNVKYPLLGKPRGFAQEDKINYETWSLGENGKIGWVKYLRNSQEISFTHLQVATPQENLQPGELIPWIRNTNNSGKGRTIPFSQDSDIADWYDVGVSNCNVNRRKGWCMPIAVCNQKSSEYEPIAGFCKDFPESDIQCCVPKNNTSRQIQVSESEEPEDEIPFAQATKVTERNRPILNFFKNLRQSNR